MYNYIVKSKDKYINNSKLLSKVLILILVFTLGVIISICPASKVNATENSTSVKQEQTLDCIAKLEKNYIASNTSANAKKSISTYSVVECVAKGNNIVIKKSDLDYYVQRAMLLGETDIEKATEYELNYLVRRAVLYNQAVNKGYKVNNSDVNSYIDEQIETSKLVDDDTYSDYLKKLGMTPKEYWNSQFDSLKIDLSISDYLASEKEKIAKKNNLHISNENNVVVIAESDGDYEKLENLWNDYYENLVQNLIDKENIVYSYNK